MDNPAKIPVISVVMPTYRQEKFIRRAIASLLDQTFTNWELIIVNDGSSDGTHTIVQEYLKDERIRYYHNKVNTGLGAALNRGMEKARASLIAYLPSDDVIYKDHLASLLQAFQQKPTAVLAYASIRHHYNKKAEGAVNNEWLQLVQVLHKKTRARWTERAELESDDLNRLFWSKLEGKKIPTGQLTCEWVNHPYQRCKIMQEPEGGINTFRWYYKVSEPLIYHTTKGNYMNEAERFAAFRERLLSVKKDGLKIVLAGELAYNAERVLALAEKGHKLYGLWMKKPYWYNYIGPLPFGHVEDIPAQNWEKEISRIQPDVIYALLNWQAVPFAYRIMKKNPGIPFIWHFKEGPFICMEKGTWNQLIELYTEADGRIYTSGEMKAWFDEFSGNKKNELDWIMDGDLPKKDWFNQNQSPLLSEKDGEIHTVVPGRPIGLHPHNVQELAGQKIHLHFYGDFTHGQWKQWIDTTMKMAPGYLHIHPNVNQENWVPEFSQYDAGWLHFFESENYGELKRANWDDLNIPARMATLALAGVPMLQADNSGHVVATQSLVKNLDIGLFFKNMAELGPLIRNKKKMTALRKNIWRQRHLFTFDHHADALLDFFNSVIQSCRQKKEAGKEGSVIPLPVLKTKKVTPEEVNDIDS